MGNLLGSINRNDNSELLETIKKMEGTIRREADKNILLQETIEVKDRELVNVTGQFNTLQKKVQRDADSFVDEDLTLKPLEHTPQPKTTQPKSKQEKKSGKKSKGKKLPVAEKAQEQVIVEVEVNSEEFARVTEELRQATQREQLLARQNLNLKSEISETAKKLDGHLQKLEFKTRELEHCKAELEIIQRSYDKQSTKRASSGTRVPVTRRGMGVQTESTDKKMVSRVNQIDIPLEQIYIDEVAPTTQQIIGILHHRAGIRDLTKVVRLLKRANEREVMNIQQQISGLKEGELATPSISLARSKRRMSERPEEGSLGIDPAILDALIDFADIFGTNMVSILDDFRHNLCSESTQQKLQNKMSRLEEEVSEFIEISKKSAGEGADTYEIDENMMPSLITFMLSFKTTMNEEIKRIILENRNLRKRLANKAMLHEGGYEEQGFSTGNTDNVLDDIQTILESRLDAAKKRTSTINFSNLLSNPSMNIIRVKRPGTHSVRGKHGSTKSEPPKRTGNTPKRAPSVMAVMKRMQMIPQSEGGGNGVMNAEKLKVSQLHSSVTPRDDLSIDTQMSGHMSPNTTNPQVQRGGGQNWLGRFEKEYQKTRLRMHRTRQPTNSPSQSRVQSNLPRMRSNRGFGVNLAVGGLAVGGGGGGHGNADSPRLESLLINTAVTRNRLNPVFGNNLPRAIRR